MLSKGENFQILAPIENDYEERMCFMDDELKL